MPSITVAPEERYDCAFDGCDNDRTPSSSVAGSYCSTECATLATGRSFLEDIKQDHRFCWSCFRQRKEIERPTDEARRGLGPVTDEALIGYEYSTPHVSEGVWGLECTCGAVDHDTPAYDVRESVPYYWYLYLIGEQLVADGQRDNSLDLETLADVHWATDALELAVGRALRA
jgi:hypothetical protein